MRFAYIDSQGNEVPIPSVDALALRIELGAIGPETQLYDAQADQWGPAESHEIFHTLSRAKDEEGFVAPPPVVPPPPLAGGSEKAKAAEPVAKPPVEDVVPEISAPVAEEAAETPTETEDLGLVPQPSSIFDLAEENASADVASGAEETPTGPSSGADSPGMPAGPEAPEDLGLDGGLGATGDDPFGDLAPASDAAEEGGAFDFGGVDSLELEEPEVVEEEPVAFGGGMDLEEPLADVMDFVPPAGGADDGGLQLDSPLSDFGSDSPPAWMEQEPTGRTEEEDTGALTFDEPAEPFGQPAPMEGAAGERERKEPVSRPSPPRRPKKSNAPAIVGLVAVVGIVGGGGYFGWKAMSGGSGRTDPGDAVPALPAVVIPDIPAELLPVMRDLAEAALADMMEELRTMQSEFDLPAEPRNDWLSGAYLGTASQFADVEEYWLGIEAYVDRLRAVDTEVFHDMYVAQVEAAGIASDTAAILVERADSGFLSARDGRLEAYRQMDDLINAALDLHAFLLANEADIAYEPAAGGISRDPVLEAIPSSSSLGDEMWGMVDDITDALDSLGTLDRVTTERLFAVLFDRIRRAGVD